MPLVDRSRAEVHKVVVGHVGRRAMEAALPVDQEAKGSVLGMADKADRERSGWGA
jgi:hypothetical protein